MDPQLLIGTIFIAGFIFTFFYIIPALTHYAQEIRIFLGLVTNTRKGRHAGQYRIVRDVKGLRGGFGKIAF